MFQIEVLHGSRDLTYSHVIRPRWGQLVWRFYVEMGKTCCVVGCAMRSGSDKQIAFFSIPSVNVYHDKANLELSTSRRTASLVKINRKDWVPSKHAGVCSLHFIRGI